MKLKNFAMITEDKVTEIFCIAYDFCKVFDTQMAKYSLWQNESANITVKAACQRRKKWRQVVFAEKFTTL